MKTRFGLGLAILCLGILVVANTPAFGQAVYGSIFGTVTDPQGAAVPGAKVTVLDERKGTTDVATTNDTGNYSVTHLVPDTYTVRVEAQGFKVSEQKGIIVNADAASRVDSQFQVGSTSESVEVTAEAPQLKTDRADVATTFNETYVENLPILNRNFTTFELLSPGTQKLAGWNHASTENPQGSQQIFVNGQHFSGTGFELDGTDNQDPILGIIVVNPNLDAITETKINLQNYDAEFGKAVAGIVTVQTKSGSNDFHGSGFWYRRTDATEARDPFTQSKKDPITGRFVPEDRWNQFGGTIGGPIIKNKLFFFGDYQGTRQASGITNQLTIPTQQVIKSCTGAGDGSGFCNLTAYTTLFGNGKWTPGSVPDPSTLLYDPTTGDQITGKGRTAFCGPAGCNTQPNWIPLGRIPTVVQNILQKFPAPSNSQLQNNFIGSGSGPFHSNSMDVRADFAASPSLNLFGRFSLARYDLSGQGVLGAVGGVGNGLGGLAGSSITHNYSLASGFNKVFSSSLLTDFRFGYFKYNPTTHKPDEGKTPAKDVGIPNVNFGSVFTSGWPTFGGDGPNGAVGVINQFGDGLNVGRCNCPLIESEQQFQFVNNWTKFKGNHQIKFGADLRHAMNLRVPSDADRAGNFSFNGGTTSNGGLGGNGFGTFLLGDVSTMNRFVSLSLSAAERQNRYFFYGQDTWRVTPKLTVDYGLRWELYMPEYVNAKGNGGFANPVEGIIRVAGYGRYGLNGNIDASYKAFAPRLGFAYQVREKTVVRMGYGRSFDIGVFGSNFGHAVTQNLPVLVNQSVQPSNNTANNGLSPNVTNAYFAAFTLAQGPPVYVFPPIPASGILPLGGPGGNVAPRMRPTFQRLPTLDAWNVTVQHQLTNTTSIEVAYVGNKGTHVFAGNGPAYDLNRPAFGPGTAIVTAAGAAPTFAANVPLDQRRPFFNHFSIPYTDPATGVTTNVVCCSDGIMGNYFGNDASANYNALQVKLDKRFSHGLQLMTNFTWSRAYNFSDDNTTSSGTNFPYAVAPRLAYGPDDMNRNKVWIVNLNYELPFGKGKMFAGNAGRGLDLLIGGWQVGDTMNLSSGLPWTPTLGDCGLVNDVGPCVPNRTGSFHVGAGSLDPINHTVTYFTPISPVTYPTSSLTVGTDTCTLARPSSGGWSLPACGTFGRAGRNSMRGPGAFTDDMSILKNFRATERITAQFRMDAYNLFNHPVLDFSSQDYGATGGGCVDCGGTNGKIKDILYGTTMRQLTFAVKLIF
jgi:Carboxypeptidase regulatory-like domain/TonB dependent receptor